MGAQNSGFGGFRVQGFGFRVFGMEEFGGGVISLINPTS